MQWTDIALTLLIATTVGCDETSKEPDAMSSHFQAGQVWTYRTRAGEENSRVVICKVEMDPTLGEIVHIHIQNVQLKNPHAPSKCTNQIGHMPYASEALKQCLGEVKSITATLPHYEDGYEEWRTAFESQEAGIWTLELADAISAMEDAMNR